MNKGIAGIAILLTLMAAGVWGLWLGAQPAQGQDTDAKKPAPIKALYITGGGYHDYKAHEPLLQNAISAIANVKWTTVWLDGKEATSRGIEELKNPNFADGYDVVVYNMCFADKQDPSIPKNITAIHKAGKPAVVIHCALHSFRDMKEEDWQGCCGLTTKSHDGFRDLTVKKGKDHPITADWPTEWKTKGDELYRNLKVWPSATSLLTAYSVESKKDHTVAWANTYGKGKVFGTTLGHNLNTAAQPEYHRLLANGLLWACDKLGKDGKPLPGYEGTKN